MFLPPVRSARRISLRNRSANRQKQRNVDQRRCFLEFVELWSFAILSKLLDFQRRHPGDRSIAPALLSEHPYCLLALPDEIIGWHDILSFNNEFDHHHRMLHLLLLSRCSPLAHSQRGLHR